MEYLLTGKDPWTGAPAADIELIREVKDAPDETRRRIKALLEADRKMIEEKKQKADNLPDKERKTGNG